ncbi:beta-glucanase [Kitasatospora sp. McL0602]|uniref:beta-glucanase n=1 Tax=Kitasatospora sp. McL0602 TaxID=3439530 RepID=UPI003F8CD22F
MRLPALFARKPSATPPGGAVVFTADFGSARQWTAGRTSAYPGRTNPGDHKLDRLTTRLCPDGEFTATPSADGGLWDCDLLTTEGSPDAFEVRTGDILAARVTLPAGAGAWPAVWTWRDGGNEIDLFEYHPDHPALLELSNHVRGGHRYWTDPTGGVAPGGTVTLRAVLGARSVDWYADGRLVFTDRRGVGRGWHAFLIVNLSVSDGTYHPAPDPGGGELSWTCHSLTVERPARLRRRPRLRPSSPRST